MGTSRVLGRCYYQQEDVTCLEEYLLKLMIKLGKALDKNGYPMMSLWEGIISVKEIEIWAHNMEK